MKSRISVKLVWRSVLSFLVTVSFVILFSGSLSLFFLDDRTEVLDNGDYKMTVHLSADDMITKTGPKDYYGRWHGPIKILHERPSGSLTSYTTEEVNMVHGKKHGKGKISHEVTGGSPTERFVCYIMGQVVDCEKSAIVAAEEPSAYQILEKKYPSYLIALATYGFDSTYVKSFTDTLKTVLQEYEFEAGEFDVYYELVLDDIDETPYDSLLVLSFSLTLLQTLEEMKNGDFRLAVIYGYNEGEFNTFGSIEADYFNYLMALNDSGITNNDFEIFCLKFDSLMMSYGELDSADPFFIDSLDTRMYRAMDFISSDESGSESSLIALKSAVISREQLSWKNLNDILNFALKSVFVDTTPKDISEFILLSMLHYYTNSDIIRQAVHEAYLVENNIIRLPQVTTQLSETTTENQATLTGTVVENGGAEITVRGFVWGESYNPTMDNKVMNSGTGLGDFPGLITGLEAGKTYFARAFATNSAGTAYGNNVRISASPATGLMELQVSEFKVFPNPATDFVNFSLTNHSGENLVLTIVDLNGRIVFKKNLERGIFQGNQLKLNVSNFENGVYYCRLTNGEKQISSTLLITR